MKKFIFISSLLLTILTMAQKSYNAVIADRVAMVYPKFDSTMAIKVFYGGGMKYESIEINITFDKCIRYDMANGTDHVTQFDMTPELRRTVLTILDNNNVKRIKQKNIKGIVHDKATKSIRIELKGKEDFSAQSSASTEITEETAEYFNEIWNQLSEFSLNKGILKKR